MGNIQITNITPAVSTPAQTDALACEQSSVTKKITSAQIAEANMSTNAEALTGTNTTKHTSPANVKYVLDNTPASATAKGIIEIATDAEALTGTDTERATTPANVKYVLDIKNGYYASPSAVDHGVDNNDLSIKDLINTIGSAERTIICQPGTYTITTPLVIPANITLKVLSGAVLTKGGSATLTINGKIDAGLYQIFSGWSAGNVIFGVGSVKEVYPQWWGAIGDDSTDNSTALAAALATGMPIEIGVGTFRFSTALIETTSARKVSGAGWDKTIIKFTGASGYGYTFKDVNHSSLDKVSLHVTNVAANGVSFENTASGNNLNNTMFQVKISGQGRGATSSTNSNIAVIFKTPLGVDKAVYFNVLLNCRAEHFNTLIKMEAGANAQRIIDLHQENYWYAFDITSDENTIFGGFVSAASGGAGDPSTQYTLRSPAQLNVITGSNGEPGVNARFYNILSGATMNRLSGQFYNADTVSVNAGNQNYINLNEGLFWSFNHTTLTENTHYRLNSFDVATTTDRLEISISYKSRNATTGSTSSGIVKASVRNNAGTLTIQTTENTHHQDGTGSAYFAGWEISGTTVYPIFFVSNNGTATTACSVDLTLSPNYAIGVSIVKTSTSAPSPLFPIPVFTSLDTTPSIAGGTIFKTNNGGATTITTFDDGNIGKIITIIFTDAVTTIAETGNIKLSAAFTSTADDTMRLIFDGTNWYELSRSVN